MIFVFFFFNDTATTEIYTLSLHDALPISFEAVESKPPAPAPCSAVARTPGAGSPSLPTCFSGRNVSTGDRKSTRLNSSHSQISYAVFCLKKKNNTSFSDSTLRTLRHLNVD